METRSLGKTDIQITPIPIGTWQAGKRMWVGIEETMRVLNKLKEDSKIRAIGLLIFRALN